MYGGEGRPRGKKLGEGGSAQEETHHLWQEPPKPSTQPRPRSCAPRTVSPGAAPRRDRLSSRAYDMRLQV